DEGERRAEQGEHSGDGGEQVPRVDAPAERRERGERRGCAAERVAGGRDDGLRGERRRHAPHGGVGGGQRIAERPRDRQRDGRDRQGGEQRAWSERAAALPYHAGEGEREHQHAGGEAFGRERQDDQPSAEYVEEQGAPVR